MRITKYIKALLVVLCLVAWAQSAEAKGGDRPNKDFLFFDSIFREYMDHYVNNGLEVAQAKVDEMNKLADSRNSRYGHILSNLAKVPLATYKRDASEAQEYLDIAAKLLKRSDPQKLHAYYHYVEVCALQFEGRFEIAFLKRKETIRMFEALQDSMFLLKIYRNRGVYYQNHGYLDSALACYDEAARWIDEHHQYQPSLYKASCYIESGDFENANIENRRAYRLLHHHDVEHEHLYSWYLCFWNQYHVYLMYLHDYDSCEMTLRQMRLVGSRLGRYYSHVENLSMWAEYWNIRGEYQSAIDSCLSALNDSSSIEVNFYRNQLLSLLIDAYEAQGNYKEAFAYQKELNILVDSLNQDNIRQIDKQWKKYHAKEEELVSMSKHRSNMGMVSIIIGISMMLLLAVLYAQVQRSKIAKQRMLMQQMEQERLLQKQKLELAESRMAQAKTQTQIRNLEDEVKSVLIAAPKTVRSQVLLNIQQLQDNQIGDMWREYEYNFRISYDGFIERLRERFPNLNDTDVKMCMLLLQGCTPKDMVTMLKLSDNTVKIYRKNLRKKLNIENPDTPIQDFLRTI